MPDPARTLARPLLVRPLLISLLPLAAFLIALAGPIRARLDRDEGKDCARHAELLAGMLTGMNHPPVDLPGTGIDGGRDRILLLDGAKLPVYDSSSARVQHRDAWFGPAQGETLRVAQAEIVRGTHGERLTRAEVRWGAPPGGGALVLIRSLRPIDVRLRQAGLLAILLWAAWAVAVGWVGLATRRRLLAERRDLLARLDAIPEDPVGIPQGGENSLGLDRSVREAAERASRRIAELGDEVREREAVLHGMLEGVVAVDTQRRVLMINPSAERMLHVETARGRPIAQMVRSAAFHDLVEAILQTKMPGELEFEFEGGRRLRVIGDVFRGREGELRGVVLVMGDVTEVRRLERIRRDFVANVSHELKTPITVIQGYMETLLDETENDPELRMQFMRTVAKNAGRMHRIIEDLLALARVESTGAEVERADFDLRDLVERCARDFVGEAASRGIRIESSLSVEPATLFANEALLERALGNLIDNAIKYARRDSVVSVRVREESGAVVFEVQDEGPGIDPGHQPRLFERFYRVDKGRSRELGGTGLGLAIVKHIAIAHGGEAGVESRLGEGSTFHVRIPRRPREETA
jgi:two-component system phosphate regulon sensor histidine kinase PhoR